MHPGEEQSLWRRAPGAGQAGLGIQGGTHVGKGQLAPSHADAHTYHQAHHTAQEAVGGDVVAPPGGRAHPLAAAQVAAHGTGVGVGLAEGEKLAVLQ